MKRRMSRTVSAGMQFLGAIAGFAVRSERAFGMPLAIAVEPTNLCNLTCPLCAKGLGLITRDEGAMDYNDFTHIVDMLPRSVVDLYLWGQGEPFLAPDVLRMVNYASSNGMRTFISTNGHFLDDPDSIIRSGLYMLIISLDGVNQKEYQSYRVGGDFNRVIGGIRGITEQKKKIGYGPRVEVQFLVTKSTISSMDTCRILGNELGVDRVVFKTIQAISLKDGHEFLPPDEKYTRYHPTVDGTIEPDRYPLLDKRCLRLYYSFQIDWQGNIVPCCFDKNSDYIMGNIFNETIQHIWNSHEYRTFRSMMNRDGRILPMCRDCTEGLRRKTIHAK